MIKSRLSEKTGRNVTGTNAMTRYVSPTADISKSVGNGRIKVTGTKVYCTVVRPGDCCVLHYVSPTANISQTVGNDRTNSHGD